MVTSDEWEIAVINCFLLSIKGGMSGAEIEYQVLRDFCKKYKLDTIKIYTVTKAMLVELNKSSK